MASEQQLVPPRFDVNEAEMAEYLRVFDCFDKDHNGKLSQDELKEMLRVVKIPKKPKAQDVMRLADTDGDGHISKDEFLQALFGCPRDQTYGYMFRCFDTDGDGRVDAHELLRALGEMENEQTLKAANHLIADLDKDGDGLIDQEEFVQLFTKIGNKNL
ncbi:calmodulin-like [Lineus longissimus]|uniref:calmodulin-like n=1 Tax=Lineus longissimus TaxID=88925 RepID=UPI002B4E8E5A